MHPIEILLIEDNEGDIRLTKEVLRETKIHNRLWVARNGAEALAFLHKTGDFENAPAPDLILLDLNLPKVNGYEVLEHVKEDALLKHIPIVVMTTSDNDEDILRSYRLHANCYVTKPLDMDSFVKVVQSIEDFWLSIVRLPPG